MTDNQIKRRMVSTAGHEHNELPGCADCGCVPAVNDEPSPSNNIPAQAEQFYTYCGRQAVNGDTSFCEPRRRAVHSMSPICHHYAPRRISWEYRYEHDSIVEIASVNQNVAEYCKHWEERALSAEKKLVAACKPRNVWKQDADTAKYQVSVALEPKCAGCGKPAWDNIHSGTGHTFWTTGSISSPLNLADVSPGGEPPSSKLPEATDFEPLWTVCSNLESILLRSKQGDYPESFRVNLKKAFAVLRERFAPPAPQAPLERFRQTAEMYHTLALHISPFESCKHRACVANRQALATITTENNR